MPKWRARKPIPLAPVHRRRWRGLRRWCSCGLRWTFCPDRGNPVPVEPIPPPPRRNNPPWYALSRADQEEPAVIEFPVRVQPHLPLRPLWICRACAGPWPCAIARLMLKGEYHDDRPALAVFMSTVLHEATAELSKLTNPGPAPEELFTRFVEWTRPCLRW